MNEFPLVLSVAFVPANMTADLSIPTPIRPEQPYRVGLIGVTGYAFAYYECLSALVADGRAKWAAVTIINPEEAVDQVTKFKELGVPIYSDYRSMLEGEKHSLDWVCIPTGIGSHTRMTIECLKLGLQVLVEKPLAPSLQDVAAIQAAERESGIAVSVGFQHTYLPETWDIKKRLLDGEIGEVKRVDCVGIWPRAQSYYDRNEWSGHLHDGNSWILDSPLNNGLSHMVNLILFWLGERLEDRAELKRVSAELYRSKPVESFDTVRTVGTMESGVEAAILLTHGSTHRIDPEIVITGSKGVFRWRFCGTHTFYVGENSQTFRTPNLIKLRDIMFDAVVDHVGGGLARICTTDLAKGTCKWVNAVHDICPIQDIASRYRQCVADDAGEVFYVVEDLEYHALRSYYERLSFSEVGAPWAILPREREVGDYTEFEGTYSVVREKKDTSSAISQ